MPKNNLPPKCSGRNLLPLYKEVLNDVWVSFPAWSEDTAFSSSRKTTFEECIYRVEDERFELDVVIETNSAVIVCFELLVKKMARMSSEELAEFELDECLGGTSPTINQRAVRRLYGEKAPEIIDGLKKHPNVAIPLVLRRLKAKDEEWREAQKQFNRTWREQMEKFYLKSLDLQGMSFKQTDVRALRSKALINEIETLFDERQEHIITNATPNSPHLTLLYKDRTILDDACLLLLHHVRRQTSIHKDDKRKTKQLLKHFLADLFHHTRMELSDEEDEVSPDEQDCSKPSPSDLLGNTGRKRNGNGKRGNSGSKHIGTVTMKKEKDADEPVTTARKESYAHASAASSTANIWSELTKQKKLSTAQESQESRRTIAKRELKLLLSDARAHELTAVGRMSLRDKVNREYLSEMSKGDTLSGSTAAQPSPGKRRATRRSFSHQGGDSSTSQTAEQPTGTVPQRVITIPNLDEDEAYTLFYANSSWYVFLRLHQLLCERLSRIYDKAAFLLMEETMEEGAQTSSAAEMLKLIKNCDVETGNYYTHFLDMIRNLLDGNMESSVYEDTLREMFGIHAYIAYTMDKVVNNAVRQLQAIMSDETSQKCLEVFHQAAKRNGVGGFFLNMSQRSSAETWYQKRAESICGEETCVKVMIFKKHCRMTMELLECDTPSDVDIDQKAKYSAYVAKFLKPDVTIPESILSALGANPVFLARNVRKWKKKNLLEWISDNARRGQGSLNVVSIKAERVEMDELPPSNIPKVTDDAFQIRIKSEPMDESDDVIFTRDKIVNPLGSEVLGREGAKPSKMIRLDESAHLVMKSLEKSQRERTAEFLMQENLQCQFNLSSYRMVYLTNSEDCIYLKGAMQRARKNHKRLSIKLSVAFQKWHQKWLTEHVPDTLSAICNDFLLDKNNTVSQRRTFRKCVSKVDKPPYRTFYTYSIDKDT